MSSTPPSSVFVGISGASGAPYALRLVQALDAAGCGLQLCVSDTGVLVLEHELELQVHGRDEVVAAFLEQAGAVATVWDPGDLAAPASSGSSAPDAVVVCPCSVATVAHIALGTTRTLIHRAADVALKERRPVVVVPRETPLTQIHLRRLLELAEAGAVVLPAMPGFYSRPQTLQDAVDHVVGKVLSSLGFEQTLFPPWDGGPALTAPGPGRPEGTGTPLPLDRDPGRVSAMFAGIAARYDLMNRLMTLGMDGGWRRLAAAEALVGDGGRALDACCGTGDLTLVLARLWPRATVVGLDFTEQMLDVARAKAAALPDPGSRAPVSFVQGDLLALPFGDHEFTAVTVGWGVRNVPDIPRAFAEMVRVTRPGGRVVCLESTVAPSAAERVAQGVWMGKVVPRLGRAVTGDPLAYAYLPASVEAFPRAGELAAIMSSAGLTRVRFRRLGFGAVALHVGEVPGTPAREASS